MTRIEFSRKACPHCQHNVYRAVVVDDGDDVRVIDMHPGTTVSELQNRL